MTLKVFVAESGSLVRLRCDPPKDFWQHSSAAAPSNNIIWRKKSPKDLIFHNNDNSNSLAPAASVASASATKWKTASVSASASGQDIQRQQSLAPFSTSNADSSKLKRDLSADASYLSTYDPTHTKKTDRNSTFANFSLNYLLEKNRI